MIIITAEEVVLTHSELADNARLIDNSRRIALNFLVWAWFLRFHHDIC